VRAGTPAARGTRERAHRAPGSELTVAQYLRSNLARHEAAPGLPRHWPDSSL